MKKFSVQIINTTVDVYEVEAEDRDKARDIVSEIMSGEREVEPDIKDAFIEWNYGDIEEVK